MDIFSSLLATVIMPIVQNQMIQAVVGAGLVKWSVDVGKKVLAGVDEKGIPKEYKGHVQLLVIVATFIATVGNLALNQQLSTLDLHAVANFITVALPTYLATMGIHWTGKVAQRTILNKDVQK